MSTYFQRERTCEAAADAFKTMFLKKVPFMLGDDLPLTCERCGREQANHLRMGFVRVPNPCPNCAEDYMRALASVELPKAGDTWTRIEDAKPILWQLILARSRTRGPMLATMLPDGRFKQDGSPHYFYATHWMNLPAAALVNPMEDTK